MTPRLPITKRTGVTPAEVYLASLCEGTFLSLWSYPTPYKDDGPARGKGQGREICDLLVVCGSQVIIFSDKHARFPTNAPLPLAWSRWFRRAIYDAAKQAWGAQRWLSSCPGRLFLDRACTQPLPVAIAPDARFHLVVVAHGVSSRVRQHFGDSGTLMLNMVLRGADAHIAPFMIGDVGPTKPFVHVLDDESLIALMRSRDTVTDFLDYLTKREALLRGPILISATGEEQMLGLYLTRVNAGQEHDFTLVPDGQEPPNAIHIDQGFWEAFQEHPGRIRQVEADRISYAWDHLIDSFGNHALQGTQHALTTAGIAETERILRFMARERRLYRRNLASQLMDMLETTPVTHRRIRVCLPHSPESPHYVFVLFPKPADVPYEEYRQVRGQFLTWSCLVARHVYRDATDIVGIATEPGIKNEMRSEDAAYFDGRMWTPELEAEAVSLQRDLNILTTFTTHRSNMVEYPDE